MSNPDGVWRRFELHVYSNQENRIRAYFSTDAIILSNKTDNVCLLGCHLTGGNHFFLNNIERNLATCTLLIRIVAFIIPKLKSKVVGNNTTYYTANIYTGMGNLAALRVRPGHYDRTGARPSMAAPTL